MNKNGQVDYFFGWLHNHLLGQLFNPNMYSSEVYKIIQQRINLTLSDQEGNQMFYATYLEFYD